MSEVVLLYRLPMEREWKEIRQVKFPPRPRGCPQFDTLNLGTRWCGNCETCRDFAEVAARIKRATTALKGRLR